MKYTLTVLNTRNMPLLWLQYTILTQAVYINTSHNAVIPIPRTYPAGCKLSAFSVPDVVKSITRKTMNITSRRCRKMIKIIHKLLFQIRKYFTIKEPFTVSSISFSTSADNCKDKFDKSCYYKNDGRAMRTGIFHLVITEIIIIQIQFR